MGVLLVFSTKYSNSELRYTTSCIIHNGSTDIIQTVIDTGAKYTCYTADSFLNIDLNEDNFRNSGYKILGGFVNIPVDDGSNSGAVKFYAYTVSTFTIGNINLGKQTIWLTFDRKIKDNILGMDMLEKVAFMQYENESTMYFFKDRKELRNYIST